MGKGGYAMKYSMKLFFFAFIVLGLQACSDENVASGKGNQQNCDPDDEDCTTPPDDEECPNSCKIGKKKCSKDGKLLVCYYADDSDCPDYQEFECKEDEICQKGECVKKTGTDDEKDPPEDKKDPPEEDCTDQCDHEGDKTCPELETGEAAWSICGQFDDDSCLEWSKPKLCAENETCNDGICTPADDQTCKDECPENLFYECAENGYHWCSDFDGDGCLEWTEIPPCPDGCNEGKCTCNHECNEANKKECSGNGFHVCTEQTDGCLKWSEITACPNTCQEGSCVCEHQCEDGKQQCSGEGYVSCMTNDQGCRVWSTTVTPCENGCENGECKSAVVKAPTRYPGDQLLSPVTEYSVQKMKEIMAKNNGRAGNVFAKIGDSHFAPYSLFMYCFAKNSVNLGDATFLQKVIDTFKGGNPNPFSRDSESAVVGKTAKWANDGGYITKEISKMNPRFAFIGYGTNDMGAYSNNDGWFTSLENYYNQYKKSLSTIINAGVIPMVVGTGLRNDYTNLGDHAPRHFVPVFNAVNRGLAEYYQIPYFNLALAMKDLKNYGVTTKDNVHHNSSGEPCNFTGDNMKYGANARNRYSIEMLHKAWSAVIQNEPAPDTVIPFEGTGKKADPYKITSIPYTHNHTTVGGENNYSTYICRDLSEKGPEIIYQLNVTQKMRIRAFVVSSSGHDMDIYLKNTLDDNSCATRGDHWVESELSPGTYYFVVDTFGEDASKAGEYLFGIVECDADDKTCGKTTQGG
jgi:hypothetical protein